MADAPLNSFPERVIVCIAQYYLVRFCKTVCSQRPCTNGRGGEVVGSLVSTAAISVVCV
jgi:hypothetical protein